MIGAGVIGLSTAVCLAEGGRRVEVRTELRPAQTTSAVASAMIGPAIAPPDTEVGRWEQASLAQFRSLAEKGGTGVTVRRGRLTAREPMPPPPGDFPECGPDELPPGFAVGYWATLALVDMVPYLEHLAARLAAAGGRIERRRVASLGEVADEVSLIVNCAGLGAKELTGDGSLTPVRGQHVIVDNPGLEEFFVEAPFSREWAAYWPYPDHVVLGGTQSRGETSTEPDQEVAERILRRCIAVEPRLGNARVRGHQVGLRPARPAVRLEVEQIGAARCVHNYGHGGSGVTLSWGSAFHAAALLGEPAANPPHPSGNQRRSAMAHVLFVCLHNAGRSQMSQALFERAAARRHTAASAGTTPADRVHPEVLEVMREVDLDLAERTPQLLTRRLAENADVVVTMGCGDDCPYIPGKRYVDWDLPDPKGRPTEEVRATRDEIARRVQALVDELDRIPHR